MGDVRQTGALKGLVEWREWWKTFFPVYIPISFPGIVSAIHPPSSNLSLSLIQLLGREEVTL